MPSFQPQLAALRLFYESGATRSYAFRRSQLKRLKQAILAHEQSLHDALFQDLRKTPEEAWVTETGFLVAEINHTLRNLKKWMKPRKVGTNLLNFPSRSFIYQEPLGVVLIIAPWNYPLQLLIAPMIGAIAAGNCVVLKSSEFAPATSAAVRKMITENFSSDFVLLTEGEGQVLVPQLMESFRFDHIFYTGSTRVGKMIYRAAAEKLIPVTLELGGKSPCIVEGDANLKVAAKRIALTKFSNAGQMCVAPDYLLIDASVKNVFLQELTGAIRKFYSADTVHGMGKIIHEQHFQKLKGMLSQGHILFGGEMDEKNLVMYPTVVEGVSVDSPLLNEEIFGPILPIISFRSFEEAKSIIDQNPDPLAFYIFTESRAKEDQWINAVHFGGGCVNNASWHLTNFNLPFGGRGNSGIGAYHGKFSFDVFSHAKAVMKTPTWFDPAIKYPPFTGKLKLFKKIVR